MFGFVAGHWKQPLLYLYFSFFLVFAERRSSWLGIIWDFLLRLPGGFFTLVFAVPFQHFGLSETFQVRLTTYWYHNICIEYVTVDKLPVK